MCSAVLARPPALEKTMATLSIRPRRTKSNPFPRSVGPLARWQKGDTHYALRADGSVVRRLGSSTWTVITPKGKAKRTRHGQQFFNRA